MRNDPGRMTPVQVAGQTEIRNYLYQVQKQLQRARTTLQELNERYELNTSQKITYLRIEEYMQQSTRLNVAYSMVK